MQILLLRVDYFSVAKIALIVCQQGQKYDSRNTVKYAALLQLGFSQHLQTASVIVQHDKRRPPRYSSTRLLSEKSSYKIPPFSAQRHRMEQLLQVSDAGSPLLVPVARAVISGPRGFSERLGVGLLNRAVIWRERFITANVFPAMSVLDDLCKLVCISKTWTESQP